MPCGPCMARNIVSYSPHGDWPGNPRGHVRDVASRAMGRTWHIARNATASTCANTTATGGVEHEALAPIPRRQGGNMSGRMTPRGHPPVIPRHLMIDPRIDMYAVMWVLREVEHALCHIRCYAEHDLYRIRWFSSQDNKLVSLQWCMPDRNRMLHDRAMVSVSPSTVHARRTWAAMIEGACHQINRARGEVLLFLP